MGWQQFIGHWPPLFRTPMDLDNLRSNGAFYDCTKSQCTQICSFLLLPCSQIRCPHTLLSTWRKNSPHKHYRNNFPCHSCWSGSFSPVTNLDKLYLYTGYPDHCDAAAILAAVSKHKPSSKPPWPMQWSFAVALTSPPRLAKTDPISRLDTTSLLWWGCKWCQQPISD